MTKRAEDMTKYYNEGPFGPDDKPRTLSEFFHTRWSPSSFDQSCKEALLEIRDKIVDFKPDEKLMRFVGDAERDPTTGPGFEVDGEPYEPRENDVVRFGTKEFVYRKGEWKEMGDEESPSWISDNENNGWNQ